MPDPIPPPVIVPPPPAPVPLVTSPTGEAKLKLPPWLAWVLIGVSAASAAVSQLPVLVPGFHLDPRLAAGALLMSIALASMGIASAGARGGPPAALLACALGAAMLSATPAQAQALSMGPAAPLMAVTPGDAHPVAFAPGTGFQVSCDLFATKLNGQPVYWLSPGLAILGTAQSNGTTASLGVSAALFVALLGLVDIGIGAPLLDSLGNGLFQHPDRRTPMIMFGLDHGLMAFLGGFGLGHPVPPVSEQACDGDHPCAPTAG